jgi:ribonuclease BN (tRNA processing enzyme)
MTTKQAAELARQAQVKALPLTHFPHVGDIQKMPGEAAKYFDGSVFLAEINKTYCLYDLHIICQ